MPTTPAWLTDDVVHQAMTKVSIHHKHFLLPEWEIRSLVGIAVRKTLPEVVVLPERLDELYAPGDLCGLYAEPDLVCVVRTDYHDLMLFEYVGDNQPVNNRMEQPIKQPRWAKLIVFSAVEPMPAEDENGNIDESPVYTAVFRGGKELMSTRLVHA